MKIPMYQVDAFTDRLFHGNPAAVCFPEQWPDHSVMHRIAAENNLSETAFAVPMEDGYHLRWFTPEVEVELCGHATLATAHVLMTHKGVTNDTIKFHTKSGLLTVTKKEDLYSMDLPARFPQAVDVPSDLVDGLQATPKLVLKDMNYLAVFETEKEVRQLKPRFRILSRITYAGFICTAPSQDEKYDFVSRYFAPYAGINEDPVTGSAHTTLTTYWSKKLNKKELVGHQISRRGGVVYCRDKGERTEISGKAVTFFTGEIDV